MMVYFACDDGLLWIVMMVYYELWWWFIMPMTYNYARDDALLWIVMVYCELRGVCYTWQISKKGVLVALPSVTLGKERSCRVSRQNTRRKHHFLLFWEPSLSSGSGFAECILMDTRQSDHKSTRCALVCRVYLAWHSAKCVNFAECFGLDTRQTLETLPSVLKLTLGKV